MRSSFAAMVAGLAVLSAARSGADTFSLRNGGQVDGTLMNATESPRRTYVIRTGTGGEVTLAVDQVRETRRAKPGEADYAKLRPEFPDTVDGQWRLAEWCRERQLPELRMRHLERVIELDSDHEKSRQILGYTRIEGEWKTRDEILKDRGMVKDEAGRYGIPQQIEERNWERERRKLVQEWAKNISRWRKWLDSDRSAEALAQLKKIDAPEAFDAIRRQLDGEENEAVRKTYVDALARMNTPESWKLLTQFSLEDDHEEIRLTCLDYVAKQPHTRAVDTYIRRLQAKDQSNEMINRAGAALAKMNDSKAVRPLIDALITTHTLESPPTGDMDLGFGSGPGGPDGSLELGGDEPAFVDQQIENPSVRDALVNLTGEDFGYDTVAWRHWLTSRRKTQPPIDARRD